MKRLELEEYLNKVYSEWPKYIQMISKYVESFQFEEWERHLEQFIRMVEEIKLFVVEIEAIIPLEIKLYPYQGLINRLSAIYPDETNDKEMFRFFAMILSSAAYSLKLWDRDETELRQSHGNLMIEILRFGLLVDLKSLIEFVKELLTDGPPIEPKPKD